MPALKMKIKKTRTAGAFPTDKSFRQEIKFWQTFSETYGLDEMACIPLDTIKKGSPHTEMLDRQGKRIGFANRSWNWDKFNGLKEGPEWMLEKYDRHLGLLIGNNVGVLDFDCEADWRWFVDKFKIDQTKYLIYKSIMSGHNCGCEDNCKYGYHIYFKISDLNINKPRLPCCIYNEDWSKIMKIDWLCQARKKDKTTGFLCRIPYGDLDPKKSWVNKNIDDLSELPNELDLYIDSHWVKRTAEDDHEQRDDKWIELLKLLGSNYVFNRSMDYFKIVRELKTVQIPFKDCYEWSKGLKQSQEKPGHFDYFKELWDSIKISDNDDKSCYKIKKLSSDQNKEQYNLITAKYYKIVDGGFDVKYIKEIVEDEELSSWDKEHLYTEIYNKFFAIINDEEPKVYAIKYNKAGQLTDVKPYKGMPDWNFVGVDYVVELGDGKKVTMNSWKKWFKKQGSAWYRGIEFKPYGITQNRFNGSNKHIFNTFPGYSMKYDPDYCAEDKHMEGANYIMKHILEIWCDNDVKLFQVTLAWFRHILMYGTRTEVMLLLYSKVHGAGKTGVIEAFYNHIFGKNLCSKTASIKQLMESQFTEPIMNKVLLVIEELPEHKFGRESSDTITDKLKSYITDPIHMGNVKYGAFGSFESQLNIVGITNNEKCLHYSIPSRRAICLALNNKAVGDDAYFNNLMTACNNYDMMKCFVHTYLIDCKSYGTISLNVIKNLKIKASTTFITHWADTRLRRNILRKNVNSLIYYFAELLNQWRSISVEEPPALNHMEGKHQPLSDYTDTYGTRTPGLFDNYKRYCLQNNLYQVAKEPNQFKLELETTLEIYAVEVFSDAEPTKARAKKDADLIKLNPNGRKGYGSYVVFTQKLLDTVDRICGATLKIDENSVKRMDYKHLHNNLHKEELFEDARGMYDEGCGGASGGFDY